MTSDDEWDPSVSDSPVATDPATEPPGYKCRSIPFAPIGEHTRRTVTQADLSRNLDECIVASVDRHRGRSWSAPMSRPSGTILPTIVSACALLTVAFRNTARKPPDYSMLRPQFGRIQPDVIKQRIDHTTQHARIPGDTILHRRCKFPVPAFNVPRREEDVASDTVCGPVAAIDNGSTLR